MLNFDWKLKKWNENENKNEMKIKNGMKIENRK